MPTDAQPLKHTASTNPHRVVMALCTLFVLGLAVSLYAGWQNYFELRLRRATILRLAAEAEAKRNSSSVGQDANVAGSSKALPSTPAGLHPATSTTSSPPTSAAEDGPTPSLMSTSGPVGAQTVPATLPPAIREAAVTPTAVITPAAAMTPTALSLGDVAKTESTGLSTISAVLPEAINSKQIDTATDVLQKFWHSANTEERAKYVVDAARVLPLMKAYYEEQKNSNPQSGTMLGSAGYRINGRSVLLLTYSSSRPGDSIEIALIPTSEGSYLIDWESYIGYSELPWPEFKKQRISYPILVRCFAGRSDYYNYEFEDQARYLALNLISPDGLYSLHGYCEQGSSLAKALTEQFSRGPNFVALTLRLAFPEKSKSDHCVNITGIVADRWLLQQEP